MERPTEAGPRAHAVAIALACSGPLTGCLLLSLDGLTGGPADGDSSSNPGVDGAPTARDAVADMDADASAVGDDSASSDRTSHADSLADVGAARDASVSDVAACTPLGGGMIAHFTMAPGSVSSTTLNDVSGSGHSGQLIGFGVPATTEAGPFGPALEYPESDAGYVYLPALPLDTTSGHNNTFAFWYYRSSQSVNDVLVYTPSYPRYDLWLTGSDICFNTGIYNCWGISSPTLFDRWVHVVAVFANGPVANSVLYIDGREAPSTCIDLGHGMLCDVDATATAPVSFGGTSPTDFAYYGLLEEIRVYNRALTIGEVQALYGGTACP
jgi:hypothetical protein